VGITSDDSCACWLYVGRRHHEARDERQDHIMRPVVSRYSRRRATVF
jgi:hypothetical protein